MHSLMMGQQIRALRAAHKTGIGMGGLAIGIGGWPFALPPCPPAPMTAAACAA